MNPSQPIPKDSHHKSQNTITSLTSYYVWSFKACYQQEVTQTHTLIKHAQFSTTTRHMGHRYIKPIFGRYGLCNLHGKFCGHQLLIPDLKALKNVTSFNSVGTIFQTLGPKNDRLSVPLYTLLTDRIEKCKMCRSW